METATSRNGGRRYLDCVWEFSTCGSSSSMARRGIQCQTHWNCGDGARPPSLVEHPLALPFGPGWSLNRWGLRALPVDGVRPRTIGFSSCESSRPIALPIQSWPS